MWGKRSPKTLEYCERKSCIVCEQKFIFLNCLNPVVNVLLKCIFHFSISFHWHAFLNSCTQICCPLAYSACISSKASTTAVTVTQNDWKISEWHKKPYWMYLIGYLCTATTQSYMWRERWKDLVPLWSYSSLASISASPTQHVLLGWGPSPRIEPHSKPAVEEQKISGHVNANCVY